MVGNIALNVEDMEEGFRHWHPQSEKYAGGDALASALFCGWKMPDTVFVERHWHAGARRVNIYFVKLTRGNENMTMPVIGNPYVARLFLEQGTQIVAVGKHKISRVHHQTQAEPELALVRART
jgi:hypothetical protein